MIKVSRPSIGKEEYEAIAAVLASSWIGAGRKVAEFEEKCREIIGCRYFFAVCSCTKAIELTFILSGYERGDEVIIPSLSYVSVAHVIVNLGMVPVFVDIDKYSLNISVADVKNKITDRTRFIVPLHFRGHACEITELKTLVSGNNIAIIEDAAHAFGSYIGDSPVGKDSYAACFSFGPLKNICCIEGGGIATNDEELANKVMLYRNMGMDRSTWQRYGMNSRNPWEYWVSAAGDKCQMNDVNAAMGLAQLARMQTIKDKKKKIVDAYISGLAGVAGICLPEIDRERDFLYIFPILMSEGRREAFMTYMLDKGIATAVHYYPAHLQPYFREFGTTDLECTTDIGDMIVTLPSYTDLSVSDQDQIIDVIRKFKYQ